MKKITIFLIRTYKTLISPYIIKSCKFHPTCSEYSIKAIEKFGFFKGIFLSIKRIIKCNPFSKGGYDPI